MQGLHNLPLYTKLDRNIASLIIQFQQFQMFLSFKHIQIQKNNTRKQKIKLIMNFHYPPCFLMYYPPEYYYNLSYNNFFSSSQQNQICFQNPCTLQKEKNQGGSTQQDEIKNSQLKQKNMKIKKIKKNKEKKCQSLKSNSQDIQFRHRQQTANRNLCSNTLKVFFKQLRDERTQTYKNINKIIKIHKLNINLEQFMVKINFLFPQASTYISFDSIKRIFNSIYQNEQDKIFFQVFRILFVRFYEYEIFAVNIKSIRTTRKIRNQQIKQGKIFLRELIF